MKKLFCTFVALIGFQAAVHAQMAMGWPDKEDLEKVKSRTMLVVLREEDPKLAEKLKKKPAALASYQADIAAYNEKIQKIAPQFWTLSKEVVFKPESELKALQKSKSKEYAYLEFKNEKLQENYGSDVAKQGAGQQWTTSALEIRFIEKPSAPPAGYATLLTSNPTNTDLAIAVKYLQSLYNNIENKDSQKEQLAKGIQKLKTKTLLLDQELLAPGLTEKTVKAVYPAPFKITDKATIEKAVMNSEKEYAVVSIIPAMGMPMVVHMVTDTEGVGLSGAFPTQTAKPASFLKVTKESLAQYLKGR